MEPESNFGTSASFVPGDRQSNLSVPPHVINALTYRRTSWTPAANHLKSDRTATNS